MALTLIVIGTIVAVIGWIWILIHAFSEDIMWGIGSLFCGILAIVYGVLHWEELKVPTIIYITGLVIGIIGRVI